jgi:hypothetical protein
MVLFNADPRLEIEFQLPAGRWDVLADKDSAGTKPLRQAEGSIRLNPVGGAVLKLK